MSERFTEIVRAASEPGWSDAVGHRFVKQLFAGTVPDAVIARYLIQDHRFLDSFLTKRCPTASDQPGSLAARKISVKRSDIMSVPT